MPKKDSQKSNSTKSSDTTSEREYWYVIRSIIDERRRNGEHQYKVDWEDDPRTGKSFPPDWVSHDDVSLNAIAAWQKRAVSLSTTQATSQSQRRHSHDSIEDSEDSELLRPPTSRRSRETDASSLTISPRAGSLVDGDRPGNRLRTGISESPAHGLTSSSRSISPDCASDPWQIREIHAAHRFLLGGMCQIYVQIPKDIDVDRSEYRSVILSESQASSQLFSQSSALEFEGSQVSVATELSNRTIPDSQEWSYSQISEEPQRSAGDLLRECPGTDSAASPQHGVILDSQDPLNPAFLPTQNHDLSLDCSHTTLTSSHTLAEEPTEGASLNTSGSEIPSRQPDSLEAIEESQRQISLGLPADISLKVSSPRKEIIPTQASPSPLVFLSQPDFQSLQLESSSGGRVIESSTRRLTSPDLDQLQPEEPSTSDSAFQQAAQIIPGLVNTPDLCLHTEEGSNRESFVPETVLRRPQWQPEEDSISTTLANEAQRTSPVSRPQTLSRVNSRSHSNMNPIERLLKAQEDTMRETMASSPLRNRKVLDLELDPDEEQSSSAEPPQSGTPGLAIQPSTNPSIEVDAPPSEPNGWTATSGADDSENPPLVLIGPEGVPPAEQEATGPINTTGPGLGFGVPLSGTAEGPVDGLVVFQTQDHPPGTVSPADITRSVEGSDTGASPPRNDVPNSDPEVDRGESEAPQTGNTTASSPATDEPNNLTSLLVPVETSGNEFIVTLPLASNMRPEYVARITESRHAIEAFTATFAGEILKSPDKSLVVLIDELFARLLDICDYPTFMDGLSDKTDAQTIKNVAVSTNSKFSFILEFLEALKKTDKSVLIVVRSKKLVAYVEAILGTEGFTYSVNGMEYTVPGRYPLRAVVVTSDKQLSGAIRNFDVVIGFDHAFRTSAAAKEIDQLWVADPEFLRPLTLQLVITHSIEHIDLRVSPDLETLERKNALLISLVQSRGLIGDPDRGYEEPYQIAQLFAGQVKEPSADFSWQEQTIPDVIFDVYITQAMTQRRLDGDEATNSRKRRMEDTDGESPKRIRMNSPPAPVLDPSRQHLIDDSVRALLMEDDSEDSVSPIVEIPSKKLAALQHEVAELEQQLHEKERLDAYSRGVIQRLEIEANGFKKTFNDLYPKLQEALLERTQFEAERDAAKNEVKAITASLEASKAEIAKLKDQAIKAAEATETTAASGSPAEELREALEAKEKLVKKLESSEQELDYIRGVYQNASRRAAEMQAENAELEEQVKELKKKSSETLLEVHRVQAADTVHEFQRMLEEQTNIAREREREVERLREEVRALKNGRRETRQASVPRSPRLGIMSPRTGRAGIGGGGSASRGTSPAPMAATFDGVPQGQVVGMQFFTQQTGNGRWGHLRD